jgi:transcriptional regulator with XRE-family HTH domain
MVGIEIKRQRQKAGISGHLVCRQSGLGRSRLSDIEREYVDPSPAEVERIRSAIEKLVHAKERVAQVAKEVGWPL